MDDQQSIYPDQTLVFGPFTLYRSRKLLLDGSQPVKLGGRAFDILVALVERAGDVVSKQQLTDCVWPNVLVEESSLRVHVSALRKALGEGQDGVRFITNVAGRGYCFVAPVNRQTNTGSAILVKQGSHNLPARFTRLVGREENLRTLAYMLPLKRFVTIAGAGGMGKTTVALALGEQLLSNYPDGVRFADFGVLTAADQVYGAVGAAIGLSLGSGDKVGTLLQHLSDRKMLLIFDSCDRVVDAVADVANALLQRDPDVHILATSREPLMAHGEFVHRLNALPVPEPESKLTAATARNHASVQLFVERAIASVDTFALTDANAQDVSDICRQLDGMPLAIELAAARVEDFGLTGLKLQLQNDVAILTTEQRAGLARHRTLRSMLDWSYDALTDAEQAVLARLSVFRGGFTLEAAIAITTDSLVTRALAIGSIGTLSMKSLLMSQVSEHGVTYRALDTTRAYAYAKLEEMRQTNQIRGLHANYLCTLFDSSLLRQAELSFSDWREIYGITIDDVRSALKWAFEPGGDALLGIRLTAASIPLWYQLAFFNEIRENIKIALLHLNDLGIKEPVLEMRLHDSIGTLTAQTEGPYPDMEATSRRTVELAQDMTQEAHQLQAINGLWVDAITRGDYPASLQNAESMASLARASSNTLALLVADRLLAQSLHYMGAHDASTKLAERVLRHPTAVRRLSMSAGTPLDRRVSMRILLSRISWLQGFADQATEIAAEAVELATNDVPYSLCQALSYAACPIAFWRGDFAHAASLTERLIQHCSRISSVQYSSWAINFETAFREAQRGAVSAPDSLRRPSLAPASGPRQKDLFATISSSFLTPEAVARAMTGEAEWSAPEVMRVEADAMSTSAEGQARTTQAAELLIRSIDLARAQKALAWELRAATSLAALCRGTDRWIQARDQLHRIHDEFTEGSSTADLTRARETLDL